MGLFSRMGFVGLVLALTPLVANAQDNAPMAASADANSYLIGPGDSLDIFVWKNPDLSVTVPVRPDGKISTPLVADIQAQGETPSQLAASLHDALSKYIQNPVVTVLVKSFAAPGSAASIRVIGAAVTPKAVPYRAGLTALDVIIDVGGLSTYADGDASQIVRKIGGKESVIPLHLADLMKAGDLNANVQLMPGDIIRIPQRWY